MEIVFLATFISIFATVFFTAIIFTWILPQAYSSKARIHIERDALRADGVNHQPTESGTYDPYFIQTQMEVIKSAKILDPVIERLGLNPSWQKKYATETQFKTSDSQALFKQMTARAALSHMIELRAVRNTSLIDITAYCENPNEAAQIANTIAEVYHDCRQQARAEKIRRAITGADSGDGSLAQNSKEIAIRAAEVEKRVREQASLLSAVEIIEHAEASARPIRPNKPLNIFLGGVVGAIAGVLGGGVVAFIVYKLTTRARRVHPPILQP